MKKSMATAWAAAFCFILLILDAKTALLGATEGVTLCLQVLIPSLFPFFILSLLLTNAIAGQQFPLLKPLGRLCGIPTGCESLLMVGLLGGYPVGAQSIVHCYEQGQLSGADARRMLGFCNNAGPSFLFGMVASRFDSVGIIWALWGIHMLSALLVGAILPGKSRNTGMQTPNEPLPISKALDKSLHVMATVCGWVILFRVMIAFFSRWFLWLVPGWAKALLIGMTELANGCCELELVGSSGLRFVLVSCLLAFGGLCVSMQTISVTGKLGIGLYFPGKAIQTAVSLILASLSQYFLFRGQERINPLPLAAIGTVVFVALLLLMKKKKKVVAFPKLMVYNHRKDNLEVTVCSFGNGSKDPAPTASTAQS